MRVGDQFALTAATRAAAAAVWSADEQLRDRDFARYGPDELRRARALVARIARQPGQKETRYGQLLVDVEQAHARPPSDHTAPTDSLTLDALAREVELLRGEVAGLRTQVDGLREGTERD